MGVTGITEAQKVALKALGAMGIQGIAPGPNLSKRLTDHRVYP